MKLMEGIRSQSALLPWLRKWQWRRLKTIPNAMLSAIESSVRALDQIAKTMSLGVSVTVNVALVI